jgi:hypothetical protein
MDVLEDLRRLGNLRRSNGHNAVDGLRVERAREIEAGRCYAHDDSGKVMSGIAGCPDSHGAP